MKSKTQFSSKFKSNYSMPLLMVLHGKHGDTYINIPSYEVLADAALNVLSDRLESENYYYAPEAEKPKAPDFTKEEIAKLPESLRKSAEDRLKNYEDAKRAYGRESREWDLINKTVDEEDGVLAWQILMDRSRGEYERITLETYTTLDEPLSEF